MTAAKETNFNNLVNALYTCYCIVESQVTRVIKIDVRNISAVEVAKTRNKLFRIRKINKPLTMKKKNCTAEMAYHAISVRVFVLIKYNVILL